MTRIQRLKKLAIRRCNAHGHTMFRFKERPFYFTCDDMYLLGASRQEAECKYCHVRVTLIIYQIWGHDISGKAVEFQYNHK